MSDEVVATATAASPVAAAVAGADDRFKVYTKTGDDGTSCLFNMERRPKDDAVFEALGDVDELNVAVGIAREFLVDATSTPSPPPVASSSSSTSDEAAASVAAAAAMMSLAVRFEEIQSRLLDVGSAVATPLDRSTDAKKKRVAFDDAHVDALEAWIDAMDLDLPPLRNFILPSGGFPSAFIHAARVTCRRAERRVVPLVRDGEVNPAVGRYLNRLSDALYTAARWAALKQGKPEVTYKKV